MHRLVKFCSAALLGCLTFSTRAESSATNAAIFSTTNLAFYATTNTALIQLRNDAAQQDFQRMMDLLHVPASVPLPAMADDTNRPPDTHPKGGGSPNYTDGIRGHSSIMRSPWGNWTNYREDRADHNHFPLPDPLVMKNGEHVTTPRMWVNKRRPELLHDFRTDIYGRIPKDTPKVIWQVISKKAITLTNELTGATMLAIQKQLAGHVDNSADTNITVAINATVCTPAEATSSVPVILVITSGLHYDGGPRTGPDAREQLLFHGWGYATFSAVSVQPDSGAGLHQGIIGLVNQGGDRGPAQWGTLSAWSWGLSRVMDYFQTDPAVDARRVGLEGHSRWGKEALVAMAFDPRFAIVYCSCSGEGGAKLHRHDLGESVDNVTTFKEYHWMAGNFLKYAGHWNDLPVDSHELIALCAPRPVFVTGGTQDLWSDPTGEFLACVNAGPVYRLLKKDDLGATNMPAPDVALISGDIGFRLHEGGHTDSPDWPTFIKFADKYFQPGASK